MNDNIITAIPGNIEEIEPKMKFSGKVVKTTLAGAIVDIGIAVPGVVHISQLQQEPVKRVEDVVKVGEEVTVWVRRVYPKKNRIELTMIEPLALEWRELEKDMVVKGKITRLEKFGAFVDIGSERPGLVHISELTHDYIRTVDEVVKEGDEVEVKVLEVNRRKKQIRLSMKALEEKPEKVVKAVQSRVEKKEKREKEEPAEAAAMEAPIPTAMEMALREAMGRVKQTDNESTSRKKRKSETGDQDLGNILERTLKNKVSTK